MRARKLSSDQLTAERTVETDARITDVLHTLDDPVEYVRRVVGNFFRIILTGSEL
jgi:hypothetical protein